MLEVQKKAVPLQSQNRILHALTGVSQVRNPQHESLGYGVMVTLQILVLPFLVRVRVPQQEKWLSA